MPASGAARPRAARAADSAVAIAAANTARNAASPSGPLSARRSSTSLCGRRGTMVADMTPSAAASGSACSGNITGKLPGPMPARGCSR